MSLPENDEIVRECDKYLARLRLSIDVRLEKMRAINKTVTENQIWILISNALEAFSLLETAQQYEEFVDKFNRKIRERKTALNNISSRLNDQKSSNGKTDDVSETNKGSGSTYYVGPSLSGKSLTEACHSPQLQVLIERDPRLRGVPLRCAAVSKLCELRVKAQQFLEGMSREEEEVCSKTRHVRLEPRLRGVQDLLGSSSSCPARVRQSRSLS